MTDFEAYFKIEKENSQILIVDDSPSNLALLRLILEPEGYHVSIAMTGEQAINITKRISPAVILLDVMMPGIDGFETCKKLKQIDSISDSAIIFISAKAEMEDVLQGFQAGGVDYITKPFKKEEVLARVKSQFELVQLQKDNRELIDRHSLILNAITDGVIEVDQSQSITFVNPAAEAIFGKKAAKMVGQALGSLFESPLPEMPKSGHRTFEIQLKKIDGGKKYLEVVVTVTHADPLKMLLMVHDVSHQKAKEHALMVLSQTDALTELPNRRHFEEQMMFEWNRAVRNKSCMAMLMIDIDYFKKYNDTYGHIEGDNCIKQVASILARNSRRANDLAARYGGEEFVILISNSSYDQIKERTEQIMQDIKVMNIEHSLGLDGRLTVSIGGATVTPTQSLSPIETLKQIDALLYEAKAKGRNTYALKSL